MGLFLLGAASIHVRPARLPWPRSPTPRIKAAGPPGHTACHSVRCANASTASRRSRQIVSAASFAQASERCSGAAGRKARLPCPRKVRLLIGQPRRYTALKRGKEAAETICRDLREAVLALAQRNE